MKKRIGIVVVILLMVVLITSCKKEEDNKPIIVTTLFPHYDIARTIAGENFNIKMLLSPGEDTHSYDPSVRDIVLVKKAKMFIYTGDFMETWASKIVEGLSSDVIVVDFSKDERIITYELHETHDGNEHKHHHKHSADPHIWTNPRYVTYMVEDVLTAIKKLDNANSAYYEEKAAAYIKSLNEIDTSLKELKKNAKRTTLYFGAPFAFLYLTEEYGFDFVSAYDSCSMEVDPAISTIIQMNEAIKKENIPVIYIKELMTDNSMAKTITKGTSAAILVLHSGHNVSREDFNNNISYLDILKNNIKNLERGLL